MFECPTSVKNYAKYVYGAVWVSNDVIHVIQVQQNSPYIHIATTALKISGNYIRIKESFF